MTDFLNDIDAALVSKSGAKTPVVAAPATADFMADIDNAIANKSAGTKQAPTVLPQKSREPELGAIGNTIYGAAKGAADLVQAPAQLAINAANSGLRAIAPDSSAAGFVGGLAKRFNEHITNQENQYQQETPGSVAAGVGRTIANVAPFLMTGGGSAAASAGSKLGALLKASGAGAGISVVSQPINNVVSDESGGNDFMKQKLIQAGIGAAGGGIGSALGGVLSKVVSPDISPAAQAAIKEGITPTPGQILGGAGAAIENKLTSVPFIGDAIKNAQSGTINDFNRAAYNRVLKPIGQSADNLPLGNEGIAAIKKTLGDNYDNILSKVTFKGDAQAGNQLAEILKDVNSGQVTPEVAKQFGSILKNNVLGKMSNDASLSGDRFKVVQSDIGNLAKQYGKSLDPNQQILGRKLAEVQDVLKANLTRGNPEYAPLLNANNEAYANYVRLRAAASGTGTDNGIFTPAQLGNAVRSLDKSVGKGDSAAGKALMQDLVQTGKAIAPTVPDSGTAGRLATMGAGAFAFTNPMVALPLGAAGSLLYSDPGKKAIAMLLTKRPDLAPGIAEMVRNASPAIGAVAAQPLLAN